MQISGVVVSYQGWELLDRALKSVEKFYPDLDILVIDGSPDGETREYVKGLDNKLLLDFNISHGRGLHLGITIAPTDYVLCFDSDIEIIKPPLDGMMELMDDETFGIGRTLQLPCMNWNLDIGKNVTYLYPHFHIINRHVYRKFLPYVHSAAPGQITFIDIAKQNKESVLKHFDVDSYVRHYQGGTSQPFRYLGSHRDNWVLQNEFF